MLAGLLRIKLAVGHYQSLLEILCYLKIGIRDEGRWWQAPTLKRRLAQCTCYRLYLQTSLKFKMGIQSGVKFATWNIKKNNTSNPQTKRVWSRRVTEVAADLERSGDTAK
jgi:hypothetical protein